jgi:hypothetical protein
MTNVFLLFAVLYGSPQGPTAVILPSEPTCRQELNMIQGMNQANDRAHTGLIYYGSCEPREHVHESK